MVSSNSDTCNQYIHCLCGADNAIKLGDKNGFNVVRCLECSMVYVNPQPTNDELQSYYSSQYWNQHQADLGLKSIEERINDLKEKAYFSDLLNWLTARVPLGTGMRLLEIGCSHGLFCELANKLDVEIVGVEMDEDIAQWTQKRTGLTIHSGGLANQSFKEAEFDVITLFDVFEHFTEPALELERIRRSLKPNGWLYLSTPCRDEPSAQTDIIGWGENKPPEHLFLFSYNDLESLLLKHGFHIWDARGIYSSRMFVLARKDNPPEAPYIKPPLWRTQIRGFLRTAERNVRHFIRSLPSRVQKG